MKVSDSSWHRQLSDLGNTGSEAENPYCPYLVGSYDRVADEVARYVDIGYRTFILEAPANAGRHAAYRRRVRARRRALPRVMTALLQHGVTAQAEARPDAVALVFKDTRLTYGTLEEASNRLAHLLKDAGCRRGDRVGLLMPKMPTAIVAMLGALKADAIYVPMDPASPAARQARVLEVSDCRCILAAGPVGPMLRDALATATLQQRPVIGWLDDAIAPGADAAPAFTSHDLTAYPATAPASSNGDGDVAHILFTSGSTGLAKGVMTTRTMPVIRSVPLCFPRFHAHPAGRCKPLATRRDNRSLTNGHPSTV